MRQITTKGARQQYSVYLTEHEIKLIKNLEHYYKISGGISGVLRHCLLEVFDRTYRFQDDNVGVGARDDAPTGDPNLADFIVGPATDDEENKSPSPLDILPHR